MNRRCRTLTLAALTGLPLTVAAAAQPPAPPAAPTPAEAGDKPEAVLGGPRVTVTRPRTTLVERDSDGKLKRLEERPEAAAVTKLELNAESKAAVQKVLAEHAAIVSKSLSANLGLFTQIQGARQSGDREAVQPLIRTLRREAPQLWEPPLIDRLSKAMPVERAVQMRSLVSEYLLALAAEEAPGGAGRGQPGRAPAEGGGSGNGAMMQEGDAMGGGGAMMEGGMGGGGAMTSPTPAPTALDNPAVARRIENSLVLRELARSLKSMTDARREHTERLLAGLDLSPELDAKVRGMIRAAGEKAQNGEPSREERRALIEQIRAMLTPAQNARLTENIKDR